MPLPLDGVHGAVRKANEIGDGVRPFRVDGQPDAGNDGDGVARLFVPQGAGRQRIDYSLAIAFCRWPIGVGQDGDEFVPAVATDESAIPRHRLSDVDEGGVPQLMAVGVVQRLQAVDIDHCDRVGDSVTALGDKVAELLHDGGVVEHAGERISPRPLAFRPERALQRLPHLLALGDVERGGQRSRLSLKHGLAQVELDPALLTGLGDDLDLTFCGNAFALLARQPSLFGLFLKFRMDGVPEVHREQFFSRVAAELFGRGVHIAHLRSLEDEDRHADGLGQGAELALALPQRLFYPLALGDVADGSRDEYAFVGVQGAQADLHRELTAIPASPDKVVETGAHGTRLVVGEVPCAMATVRCAEALRD